MASRKRKRARNRRRLSFGAALPSWLLRSLLALYALLALGECARWVWLGELSQQLGGYLLLPLWVLTVLALQRRAWWTLAPALLASGLSLASAWPLLRSVSDAPSQGPELRLVALGLDGRRPDAADFARWLRAIEADLVVLTGVAPDPEDRLRGRAGYRAWTVRPRGDASITLMSRLPVLRPPVRGKDGAVRARFRADACELDLTALRAPSVWDAARASKRKALFEQLGVHRKHAARVWVGDFGGNLEAPGPSALLERGRLTDSRRGFGRQATWPAMLGALGVPMDHILVGGWIAVRERSIGPRLHGASRRAVVARLQLTAPDCARTH